jgi:Flp pilus assembly protein TadG
MRDNLGQAFVELALVLPIFILLLVGAAEFARLAYASIEVSNAARAGVAYGAQNHTTASDTTGMQTAATDDGPNVTGLAATATNFCACSTAPSTQVSCSTVLSSCSTPPAHSLEYVKVTTTATVDPLIHFPGLPTTFTLHGQAIMRVEQ